MSELKPSAKIYNCSETPQAKGLTFLLNSKAKSFLPTANSQIDKPKYQGISQLVCVSNSLKNIPEQESTPLHSLNPNAEPFNPMFDFEKLNDALGKCIKLCVNKSNQLVDIIFNLFSVISSACLLISIVSLSFDNDLNINEIHMPDVPYRGLGKSISQVDGENCETCVYIDSNVSIDNVNHFAGKYNDFKLIIPGNIDIMILVETKLDNSYPTLQFLIDSYSTPFRRDRNKSGGGI